MRDQGAKARARSEEEPKAPVTGRVCFDITIYDEGGNWLGSGGVYPLSWITLTPEGVREDKEEGAHLREFLNRMKKSS